MSKFGEKLKLLLGLGGTSSSSTTMKPSAVLNVASQITKMSRHPMIRFRKGSPQQSSMSPASPTSGGAVGGSKGQSPGGGGGGGSGGVTEDWELPPRFRRRPLDPEEIAYINRGGPE